MTVIHKVFSGIVFAVLCTNAFATDVDFSGHWTIDIRTQTERKQNLECGRADFSLKQVGDKIIGDHTFSTPGCGRLNEGGAGSVKGIVVGKTAVLVVTSGRNGEMLIGKATRSGNQLQWNVVDNLKPGQAEGDSALILVKGTLTFDPGNER